MAQVHCANCKYYVEVNHIKGKCTLPANAGSMKAQVIHRNDQCEQGQSK